MKSKIITILGAAVIFSVSTYLVIMYVYSQRFVQKTSLTATKGIFFKKTLNLDKYENVSSGNGFLGNYDRYSRSDRHSEVITVYCNKFCKE